MCNVVFFYIYDRKVVEVHLYAAVPITTQPPATAILTRMFIGIACAHAWRIACVVRERARARTIYKRASLGGHAIITIVPSSGRDNDYNRVALTVNVSTTDLDLAMNES